MDCLSLIDLNGILSQVRFLPTFCCFLMSNVTGTRKAEFHTPLSHMTNRKTAETDAGR